MHAGPRSLLVRFLLVYALMYAAFGVASPFVPAFLQSRGLSPERIGLVVAVATAARFVSGPVVGRVADLLSNLRAVLATCAALAALATLALLTADHFGSLLFAATCQGAALAPITTLADALAIGAAGRRGREREGFDYAWVRGAASAAFVLGSLVAGELVRARGLGSLLGAEAALLAGAAAAATRAPRAPARSPAEGRAGPRGVRDLLATPVFRRVVLVAALVFGSHAMHDTFAVIRWAAAGIDARAAGALWGESVAAEVLVFFVVGPWVVDRIGPAGAMAIAVGAGVLRWTVAALTSSVWAIALVQPLHGLTFALLHLACMRVLAACVPRRLAATAQAIYALGAGVAGASMALVSGSLYARFGARGFFAMAALCAAALPLVWGLREGAREATLR
jgi:MFS transporter, PPP family, 3-phenylpropionic acid transporter